MNIDKFKGVFTALVTPIKNGQIDFISLEKLIEDQILNGVHGFVVNGTTGESPTISFEESAKVFKFIKDKVGNSKTIIFGTGSNSTAKTIELSKKAQDLGADGLLVVVPYYNKPPQRGLVQHFTQVAESIKIPLILYNVPGRTVTSLNIDSIIELSKVKNIIGIKEASGNIEFVKEIRNKCGNDFIILSGDDETYISLLRVGGNGVISVTSHIFPREMVYWYDESMQNNLEHCDKEFQKWLPLTRLLFVEANPIPVKKALQLKGILISSELRLPLVELESSIAEKLKLEMMKLGLLK